MSLESQDFCEELGVHHATDHLASETIVHRMTLEKGHREAPQPAEIVAQGALPGAAVVLAEVHVQDPVHRLDAPVAADRLAEPLAAEITAEDVEPRLVRLAAVRVSGDSQGVADRLDPRPLPLGREVGGDLGEEVRSLIDPAVCGLARLVAPIAEVLQVALQVPPEVRFDRPPESRLVVLDADHEIATALDDAV